MTPKIKELTCTTCNGTGFPTVKQPMLATHKIYPVKCTACAGKGRIADSNRGGLNFSVVAVGAKPARPRPIGQ
jgi:DnaJ-class molecular chaperone